MGKVTCVKSLKKSSEDDKDKYKNCIEESIREHKIDMVHETIEDSFSSYHQHKLTSLIFMANKNHWFEVINIKESTF